MIDREFLIEKVRTLFAEVRSAALACGRSGPKGRREAGARYRASVLRLLAPSRGCVVLARRGTDSSGGFFAVELLQNHLADIATWEVLYDLPFVSTDIYRPLEGVSDDEAVAEVPIVIETGSHGAASPLSNVLPFERPQEVPPRLSLIRTRTIAIDNVDAAWATSLASHSRELERQFGPLWAEAAEWDKKRGKKGTVK